MNHGGLQAGYYGGFGEADAPQQGGRRADYYGGGEGAEAPPQGQYILLARRWHNKSKGTRPYKYGEFQIFNPKST